MKKRLTAAALFVLILFVWTFGASGADSICFVGINDSVPMYLSANEVPYNKGMSLYVPYTVFQAGPGGVAVSYNVDKGSLVLFTRAKRLVYDLNAGTVTDEAQKVSNVDVVYRNGIVFVPVARAANHFGFSATMLTSSSGSPVLRFTDGSQQLDNSTFIRKAETLISIILEQEQMNDQSESAEQGSDGEQGGTNAGPATVYLAFAGEAVSDRTLQTLQTMRVYGTFFLTESQIRTDRELVRDILTQGHQIGLTVEAEATEDHRTALQNANEALDRAIFRKSVIALLPVNTEEIDGYVVFKERTTADTIDDILRESDTAQLFVCRTDATYALQRLLQEGAYTPKLLETTRIPGISVAQ